MSNVALHGLTARARVRRFLVLPAIFAGTTAALVLPGAAGIVLAAQAAPSVTFTAAIPSELAGGAWALASSTLLPAKSVMLASGQLTAGATSLTTVIGSAAALVPGGTNEFSLHVVRPIDGSHAWAGGAVEGLTPDQIVSGPQVALTLHLDKVATTPLSEQQFTTSSSAAQAPSQSPAATTGAPPAQKELFQPPVRSNVPQPPTGPAYVASPTSSSSPTQSCVAANACGQSTPVAVDASNCSPGLGTFDCIVDAQDIHGVGTFRGYSAHVAGEDQTFDVQQSNTDQMDNGYRASIGPFSIGGHSSISNGTGSDTTWPVRGYCWNGTTDPNGCAADGSLSTFGIDSWRWEKHLFSSCDPIGQSCSTSVYESLYDRTYDGGTIVGYVDTSGYYALPSQIKAGQKGSWAPYLPGARVSLWLQRSWAYGDAADVSVSYPDSYGSTTFSSAENYQTDEKVTNTHAFMTINFLGDFYRYDNGQSPWQAEFWSCDWAPGWTGGAPCYANGS